MASPLFSVDDRDGHQAPETLPVDDAMAASEADSSPTQLADHNTSGRGLPRNPDTELPFPLPTEEDISQNDVQHNSRSVLAPPTHQADAQQASNEASSHTKLPKAEVAGVRPFPPTAKPSWRQRLRTAFSNWWTWELLSVLLSLLCFLGVIILLAVSNGKGVPQLSYDLTV